MSQNPVLPEENIETVKAPARRGRKTKKAETPPKRPKLPPKALKPPLTTRKRSLPAEAASLRPKLPSPKLPLNLPLPK